MDGTLLNGTRLIKLVKQHPLSGKQHHMEYDFGRYTVIAGAVTAIHHDGSNPSHHVLKYSDIETGISMVLMSNDGNKQTLYLLKDAILDVIHTYAH